MYQQTQEMPITPSCIKSYRKLMTAKRDMICIFRRDSAVASSGASWKLRMTLVSIKEEQQINYLQSRRKTAHTR